jgi:hypothetical protein
VHCPQCGNEYDGTPTHCVRCGRIYGAMAVGAAAPRKRKSRRAKHILLLVLGALLIVIVAGAGVGLWFSGSRWERGKWDGKYEKLESESSGLEDENRQLLSEYDDIREAVNVRLGHVDRKVFITPSDPVIEETVRSVVGTPAVDADERWADFYRLYDWVVANIMYSHDTSLPMLPELPSDLPSGLMLWKPDYWRYPSETLAWGAGDCEDMALLLASMIKNYTGGEYYCWVIVWTTEGIGHAAVAIPTGGDTLTILDPAGQFTTGLGRVISISDAVDEWLAAAPTESGAFVAGAFSDTEGRFFYSTDEFVQWAAAH